jgi:2-oxoacid:acceptor oxidoreductase delta subunit (pyruvate/2-ketoisovalerate family)
MFGPLTQKPGTSMKNKTGSWRVTKKPKFLKANCIACNMCLLICPEGCITGKEKNSYDCDFAYCKGCGNCAAVCPKQDIAMVSEGEKS